jgi:hypothetical protein
MGKRNDIDKAVRNIMNWAARPEWTAVQNKVFSEHIAPACDKLQLSPQALSAEIGESGGMLFGIAFEDFLTRRLPDNRNVIDDYLQRRGWRESPPGRRYLQLLRDSVWSVYEVVAVSRGEHCDLQDLFRGGKPVRVYEHRGTQNLVKWDRLAARVLIMDGKHRFSGGILPLTQEIALSLLELMNASRKRLQKELARTAERSGSDRAGSEEVDAQILHSSCPALSSIWLLHTLTRLHAPLPDMVNREGDPLVFSETRFPVDANKVDEIVRRLDAAADYERGDSDTLFWDWLPPPESKARGKTPEDGMTFESSRDDGRPVSGTLELKPRELLFCANSMERTEKGKQRLEKLLHGLIGPALTGLQTPEQLMAGESRNRRGQPRQEAKQDIDPAVAAEIIHEFLDNHYRQCLDQPIPALDNKTPRQCARSKSAKARAKVIEWLKYLENGEQRRAEEQGHKPYDTRWMWEELKLSDDRD